ncbi:SPOR domain-containing protein [Bermanella sp. WJH001]|uniref:SPOR domain-containing protein n=1 Tax=Bermanella sp. WJH001 TaxID=3048005 RepID=UPI0024BEA8C4|nr:SPOR domain-containing protein [Bermanella sp. WJH001]MDJ1539123.1 SPOR domain-containing protein [Bermanella sp. WJH001]
MASGAPRWVWIFTPLVALSFAVFLLYLTTVPAGDDIDKITDDILQDAKAAKNNLSNQAKQGLNEQVQKAIKEQLPSSETINKAVDNYEFFEILENKQITVEEVPEYKSTPKGTDKDGNKIEYRLKAGSFTSQERADRLKAQLILNGFNTQIESADVNGKTWLRVFTGPFANRSQMNKAQDQLINMGIQSVEIQQPVTPKG